MWRSPKSEVEVRSPKSGSGESGSTGDGRQTQMRVAGYIPEAPTNFNPMRIHRGIVHKSHDGCSDDDPQCRSRVPP